MHSSKSGLLFQTSQSIRIDLLTQSLMMYLSSSSRKNRIKVVQKLRFTVAQGKNNKTVMKSDDFRYLKDRQLLPDALLRYSDSRKANIELDLVDSSQFSFARFIWKHDCNPEA